MDGTGDINKHFIFQKVQDVARFTCEEEVQDKVEKVGVREIGRWACLLDKLYATDFSLIVLADLLRVSIGSATFEEGKYMLW